MNVNNFQVLQTLEGLRKSLQQQSALLAVQRTRLDSLQTFLDNCLRVSFTYLSLQLFYRLHLRLLYELNIFNSCLIYSLHLNFYKCYLKQQRRQRYCYNIHNMLYLGYGINFIVIFTRLNKSQQKQINVSRKPIHFLIFQLVL